MNGLIYLVGLIVVILAGLCLIELLTLTMKTVPFSCTYLPGQLKLRIYWAPYFFLWLNFCFTLSNWGLWALESWSNTARLAGVLAAIWLALRVWHIVTVAFRASSNCASGLPTRRERPITTASAPSSFAP